MINNDNQLLSGKHLLLNTVDQCIIISLKRQQQIFGVSLMSGPMIARPYLYIC